MPPEHLTTLYLRSRVPRYSTPDFLVLSKGLTVDYRAAIASASSSRHTKAVYNDSRENGPYRVNRSSNCRWPHFSYGLSRKLRRQLRLLGQFALCGAELSAQLAVLSLRKLAR